MLVQLKQTIILSLILLHILLPLNTHTFAYCVEKCFCPHGEMDTDEQIIPKFGEIYLSRFCGSGIKL